MTQKYRDRFSSLIKLDKLPLVNNFLQVITTFGLACFAWIFFRANSLSQALGIIKKIVSFKGTIYNQTASVFFFSVLGIAFLLLVEFKREYFNNRFSLIYNNNWLIKNLYYAFLIAVIILAGVFDGGEFIYFQF